MKFVLALGFLVFVGLQAQDELSNCKCWDGYQPKKDADGVRCHGILLLHIMDCNVPERPKCVCSGNVTGILFDTTGTWCTEYADGMEKRKWPCENTEEWDKFYHQYPMEKP